MTYTVLLSHQAEKFDSSFLKPSPDPCHQEASFFFG